MMKKYFAFFMLPLVAMMLAFTSCGNSKVSQLKKEVNKFNATLPQSLGSLGDITSITFDDKDNLLVMTCMINDDFMTFEDWERTDKKANMRAFKAMFTEYPLKGLGEMLCDVNAGLAIDYKWRRSGDSMRLTISADEIRDVIENPMSEDQKSEAIIDNFITNTLSECPIEVEEGMVIVNVFDDGENVMYICEVDEDLYDMDLIEGSKSEIKSSIKSEMNSDPTMKQVFNALKMANRGIGYRYIGNITGQTVDIILPQNSL